MHIMIFSFFHKLTVLLCESYKLLLLGIPSSHFIRRQWLMVNDLNRFLPAGLDCVTVRCILIFIIKYIGKSYISMYYSSSWMEYVYKTAGCDSSVNQTSFTVTQHHSSFPEIFTNVAESTVNVLHPLNHRTESQQPPLCFKTSFYRPTSIS